MAQWRSLDVKSDITVVQTITEAIDFAKTIGCHHNGAFVLITGSLRLVGGALSILEPENST
jgi:folylpolyglutamate synthase